jgi:acetolactate synthase I/III small subunit
MQHPSGADAHMLSILVDDRFGELARIIGLFSGRGYNIDSLVVHKAPEAGKSRILLTTRGDAAVLEQVIKQVNKLVRVHKVQRVPGPAVKHLELCLATVQAATSASRAELERILKLTGGRVMGVSAVACTLQCTGSPNDIDAYIEMLSGLGILDMVRSGPLSLCCQVGERSA